MANPPNRLAPIPIALFMGASLLIISLDDLERCLSFWWLLPLIMASVVLVVLLIFVEPRQRGSALWSILDHSGPSHQVAVKRIEGHFYVVTETYE